MIRWAPVACAILIANVAIAAQTPAPTPAAATAKAAELRDKLATQLTAIASGLDGVMGYSVIDLTTGDRIERLPSELFPLASTIKLALLYELFKRADEGQINLEEKRTLDRRQAVGGDGVLV